MCGIWYLPDLPQNEGICMNITSKKREYKLVELTPQFMSLCYICTETGNKNIKLLIFTLHNAQNYRATDPN